MKRKSNLDDLRWVRLFTGSHIPRYLVEQIAKRDYEIDDLYKYIDGNILRMSAEGPTLNPLFHLWALVNPENLVRGFLWFTIDPLTLDILIQVYSVDANYWGCKAAVHKLAAHVKDLRKKGGLKKIYWATKFPRHSQKYGFKPSQTILMEYDEETEVKESTTISSAAPLSPKAQKEVLCGKEDIQKDKPEKCRVSQQESNEDKCP